jgi:hypothetical protein
MGHRRWFAAPVAALGIGRVPHARLSVRGPKMICFDRFCCSISQKTMVGFARFIRPTYAEANVGHPSSSDWVLLESDSCRVEFLRLTSCPDTKQICGLPQRFAAAGFAAGGFAEAGASIVLPGPPTGSSMGSLCSTGGRGGKGACGSV